MKRKVIYGWLSLALSAMAAQATPVLTVTQPGNNQLATPTKPVSLGGTTITFDSLTPFTSYAASYTTSGVSFSSPDGLLVLPYSTQSGPSELYDNSAAGSANLMISSGSGYSAVGVGIADSDPVTIAIQALGAGGALLGPVFYENLAATESTVNTGNGYYVIRDTTNDIFGLQITEAVSNLNYSGLAIDDVQFAATPEPSSLLFLAEGALFFGTFGAYRKLKQA